MNSYTKQQLGTIRRWIKDGTVTPPPVESIKEQRLAKNISMKSLADAAVVTKSTIQAIEQRHQASPEMLVWMQRVLHLLRWDPYRQCWSIKHKMRDQYGRPGTVLIELPKRVRSGGGWRRHSLDTSTEKEPDSVTVEEETVAPPVSPTLVPTSAPHLATPAVAAG